jgi:hypothetical protein
MEEVVYPWESVAFEGSICPPALHFHSSVIYGTKMYIFGGSLVDTFGTPTECSDKVWTYDLESKRWNLLNTWGSKPCARKGHTAVIYQHQMFVFGGLAEDHQGGWVTLNDAFVFDFKSECWKLIPENGQVPSSRGCHSACADSNYMYIYGGYHSASEPFLGDFYRFDLTKRVWKRLSAKKSVHAPCNRRNHCMAVHNGQIFVVGGETDTPHGRFIGDIWMTDVSSPNDPNHPNDNVLNIIWQELTPTDGPSPRKGASLLWHVSQEGESRLLLFGGCWEDGSDRCYLNDCFIFVIGEGRWKRIVPFGFSPPATYWHSAVHFAANNCMYVFAGKEKLCTSAITCLDLSVESIAAPMQTYGNARLEQSESIRSGALFGRRRPTTATKRIEKEKEKERAIEDNREDYREDKKAKDEKPALLQRMPLSQKSHPALVEGADHHRSRKMMINGSGATTSGHLPQGSGEEKEKEKNQSAQSVQEYDWQVLATSLQGLLEKKWLADITITVGREHFLAHSCILAARSLYCRQWFLANDREGERQRGLTRELVLSDTIAPPIVAVWLEFVYSAQADINVTNVLPLMSFSHEMQTMSLLQRTEQVALSLCLCPEYAAPALAVADKCGAMQLRQAAIKWLSSNLRHLRGQTSLAVLPKPLLLEIMNTTLL